MNSLRVGFDTETTSVDNTTARILTVAMVNQHNKDNFVGKEVILNPGVDVPESSTKIHGMTNEFIKANGKDPIEVLDKVARALEKAPILVAYNIAYDLPLIDYELNRYGLKNLDSSVYYKVLDPMVIDRHYDKFRKGKRTLGVTAEVYGVKVEGDLHNAQTDVITTLKVLDAIVEKYPKIKEHNLNDLQNLQRVWYHDWAEGFNKFKGSEVVDPIWLKQPTF